MIKIYEQAQNFSNIKEQYSSIGLVPTMGNLHQGHLNLLEASLDNNELSIISIFVNPTQFSASEDLSSYPRTIKEDIEKITKIAQEKKKEVIVFIPKSEKEIYPESDIKFEVVPFFEKELEGDLRPTHFQGVLTVVRRLFDITKPNNAYFGKKDYQQYFLIKDMVERLDYNINVVPIEIVRETSGLAMSSRNNYLSEQEKKESLFLSQTLIHLKETLMEKGFNTALNELNEIKKNKRLNYLDIRNIKTFKKATLEDKELIILGNLQVQTTRLLDNIEVSLK